MIIQFFYILTILLVCTFRSEARDSVKDLNDVEKALKWMPWPSSVPDPNKIYTTTILEPASVTDIRSITETIRITRTIISYTTETAWSTTVRYATQSTTSFYDIVSSRTTTSTVTEIEVVTEIVDTTVTSNAVNTVFLGDVGEAQKSILINRFISSGFSTANIQFSTITITEQPRTTVTDYKTAKVLKKTTETTINTITSIGNRTVWDTVYATETRMETAWSTIKSTSTVTLARLRR
jgi:hypothetical protein